MLLLPNHCYNKVIIEAIEKYPAECCGFLLGKEANQQHVVSRIITCENKALLKEKEYLISATDYLKAEKKADKKEMSLLGVYHSHPDVDAIPSVTDSTYAFPNLSYVIISVFKHKISSARSWRLNENGSFEEESLLINTNNSSKNNTAYGNHYRPHSAS